MSFIFGNPNSPQQSVATPPIVAQSAPPTTGPQALQYSLGTIWVDTATNVVYVLTSISGGTATWVNTIPASGGTFTNLTVTPGPTSITGEFRVNANINEANVIELKENGGASGTIHIISEQGTGTASIGIVSTSGGINVETVAAGKDIQLNADLGSIALAAGEDVDQAVFISAGGGTSATMQMINLSGTAPATAVASSSLFLSSTDGGVGINAGKDFNIQSVDTSLIEVSTGDLNITADTGNVVITATAGTIDLVAGGGIDWQITGDVDLDVTGAISLDATLASNFTVTGAAADLTLSAVGGSVNMTASEVAADAIVISATGSGAGIQIAPAATVATIAIGNVVPTTARTTSINSGTVATAIADTLNLGTGATSTNAGASKVVNIATGNNLLGTNTVNIVTGTSTTGANAINMGGSDDLTAITMVGVVDINVTGTATTSIGNVLGGAIVVESASSIELSPQTTLDLAPDDTVTTIDIGNITPILNRTTTINSGVVNSAVTDTVNIATGGVSTSGSATKLVNIASGATAVGVTLLNIGSGNVSAAGNTTLNIATGNAPAGTTQAVNIGTGTGGGTKSINIGSATDFNTSVFVNGPTQINPSASTAATTIGSTTNGGAVGINSAGVITVHSADTTGSDIVITATGVGGGVVATTGSGNFNINGTGAGGTTIGSVATGGAVALNSASTITSLAANVNLNNSGTGATTIGSATGGTFIVESNTAAATAIQLNAHNAAGGITATVGTGNFLIGGGNLSLTTAAKGILFAAGPTIVSGAGSPNGSITATKGSLYLRTDGSGVNDRMYVNTDAGTTWTAVVTVA